MWQKGIVMSIRKLLVPVSGDDAARPALTAALRVATQFAAHVEGLHVRPDPQESVPLLGEGVSGAMIEDLMRLTEEEAAGRAAKALALFTETCAALDVPVIAAAEVQAGPSATWRDVIGREDDETVHRGRLADLIVLGRASGAADTVSALTLNAALFESGRPVLVAPPAAGAAVKAGATAKAGAGGPFGRRIAIAWNGSAEAARAVTAALPFLAVAEVVVLFSAATAATPPDAAGELAEFLRWHGVAAQTGSLPDGAGPVGAAILQACAADDMDLLVIGAYTHSRLRELILGGVTRHVLEATPIPLLMSH
jgi:nucleotide-binding universal stress UspA family protein